MGYNKSASSLPADALAERLRAHGFTSPVRYFVECTDMSSMGDLLSRWLTPEQRVAGITVFRDTRSLQPTRQLNEVVGPSPTGNRRRPCKRHHFLKKYALRARENACFAVLTDQAGRAGYVDCWPRDSENQPHHAGAALVWGPDGELIASTQEESIQDEMIVATLERRPAGSGTLPGQLHAAHPPPGTVRRTGPRSGNIVREWEAPARAFGSVRRESPASFGGGAMEKPGSRIAR